MWALISEVLSVTEGKILQPYTFIKPSSKYLFPFFIIVTYIFYMALFLILRFKIRAVRIIFP